MFHVNYNPPFFDAVAHESGIDSPKDDNAALNGDGATPLDAVQMSSRAKNCMFSAGVHTIERLAELTPVDVLKIRMAGQHTLDEVRRVLRQYGMQLMHDQPHPHP